MSTWTRSSACTYGNCVEVRHVDGHVEVRDSTAPDDVLHITPADWALFLVGAKAGEFDGPAAVIFPARDELRCAQCGRSSADSDRDMAAPVVYFARQGLCTPCSRSTDTTPDPS